MHAVPWLSLLLFLPFSGVLILFSMRGSSERLQVNARWVALWSSVITCLISLYLLVRFDPQSAGFSFEENVAWLPEFQLRYHLGVDGISLLFVVLSTCLTVLVVLASWDAIKNHVREYMAAFLILEMLVIGAFCAMDLVLFYVFFEAVLIPMFFVIGVWGGNNRIFAAFKLFLYTVAGSVLMLVGIVYIYNLTGTFEIEKIASYYFAPEAQMWLWLAFFASFAVKIPMWPVHTWLPDAHVEAPTGGSVILAGVLLKLGGYGFLRFSLPFFPDASLFFASLVFMLSIIAMIYASFVALAQKDIKKLIAYSSVAHMGFVTLGIFAARLESVQGAVFQMLSHGIISAGLFFSIGLIYERLHTRDIALLGGLFEKMPRYVFFLMLFVLGGVGLPGTMGFVGEFLVLLGTFMVLPWAAFVAATAMVFGAMYGLWFFKKVALGKWSSLVPQTLMDLNFREVLVVAPLAVALVVFGVYPAKILAMTEPSVRRILSLYDQKQTSAGVHACVQCLSLGDNQTCAGRE